MRGGFREIFARRSRRRALSGAPKGCGPRPAERRSATAPASTSTPAKEASLDETIKAVEGKDPAPLLTLLGFPSEEIKALTAAKDGYSKVSDKISHLRPVSTMLNGHVDGELSNGIKNSEFQSTTGL